MPRIVESAPNRIVISNMITTYGGTDPIGLPPSTSGQSYDMYSVTQAPMAQPAIPPISVNIRTGLTGCSSASSISCRGMGEYTVKSVWPARRSWAIASTVASTWPNTPSTPGVGGGWQMFMVQLAHPNGPNARYQNAARSWALPLNQATKFSVQYDMLTIRPVKRHSFARFSKWWTVMSSSRWKSFRIGTSSVITMATP